MHKVVNKTHKQNMRLVVKQNRKALPKLDFHTLWCFTNDMLENVVVSKSFLDQIGLANESHFILEDEWEIIKDLVHSFNLSMKQPRLCNSEISLLGSCWENG